MKMSPEEIESAITKGKLVFSIYGLGWMGLPTACLYAEKGARVIGVDINSRVIERIHGGESPIEEPNLQVMIKNTINKNFRVASDIKEAASISDIMIIVVPTLINEKRKPDYSALEKVSREIGLNMNKGCIIIVESTVGPGITDSIVKNALESSSGFKAGADFGLA
jgi:UDP-N-acetyl-D-mannosaminuronic acid dehydrogenase